MWFGLKGITVALCLAFVMGCKTKDTGNGPIIQNPGPVIWEENRINQLTIIARGEEPLAFSLSESPDSAFFSIDQNSGELALRAPLNFEDTVDDNGDGIYEVDILVTDRNGVASVLGLNIVIADVPESQLEVQFPLPGSNFGGVEQIIQVRGRVVGERPDAAQQEVWINGKQAEFVPEQSGRWQISLALPKGDSELTYQLLGPDAKSDTQTLTIHNHPISDGQNNVSDGESIYFLGSDAQSIFYRSVAGSAVQLAFQWSDLPAEHGCQQLSRLFPTSVSQTLFFTCHQLGDTQERLYYLNFGTSEVWSVGLFSPSAVTSSFQAYQSDVFLTRLSQHRVAIIDTQQQSLREVGFNFDKANTHLSQGFVLDDNQLYLMAERDGDRHLLSADLTELMAYEVSQTELELQWLLDLSQLPIAPEVLDLPFLVWQGSLYFSDLRRVYRVDLATQVLSRTDISPIDLNEHSESSFQYIYHVNDRLVLSSIESGRLVEINVEAATLHVLAAAETGIIGLGSETVLIDASESGLTFVDLPRSEFIQVTGAGLEVQERKIIDFPPLAMGDHYFIRKLNDSNTLLVTVTTDWLGDPIDQTPRLYWIDLDTGAVQWHLSTDDFVEAVGLTVLGSKVRFSPLSVGKTDSELWFSATVVYPDDRLKKGVYRVSIENSDVQAVVQDQVSAWQENGRILVEPDTLSLQSHTELGGFLLTSWANGRVAVLSEDGIIRNLIPPNSSFLVTEVGVYDYRDHRVLFSGYLVPPNPGETTSNPPVLYALDLESEQLIALAGGEADGPITLSHTGFVYNEANQLLFQIQSKQLMILDIPSGKRVIKELSIEQP